MKALSPNQMAWLLPLILLIHQSEEYFYQFPLWFSNLFDANLSNQDFILINGIGLFVITVLTLFYIIHKNNFILVALGTLVFVNGIIHLLLSLYTFSYSPGTISGVVLFIPLGWIILKRISPQLPVNERIISIASGVIILLIVSMIAMNI